MQQLMLRLPTLWEALNPQTSPRSTSAVPSRSARRSMELIRGWRLLHILRCCLFLCQCSTEMIQFWALARPIVLGYRFGFGIVAWNGFREQWIVGSCKKKNKKKHLCCVAYSSLAISASCRIFCTLHVLELHALCSRRRLTPCTFDSEQNPEARSHAIVLSVMTLVICLLAAFPYVWKIT